MLPAVNSCIQTHFADATALPPDPPDDGGPEWPTTANTVSSPYTPYYGAFISHSVTLFIGSQSAADRYVKSTGRAIFVASSPVLFRVISASDAADFFVLNDGRILKNFACAVGNPKDPVTVPNGFTATVDNARIQFPNSVRARDVIKRFHRVSMYDGNHALPRPQGRGSAYASSLYNTWSISLTIGNAYIERLERHNEEKEYYYSVFLPAHKLALKREQEAVQARLIEEEQERMSKFREATGEQHHPSLFASCSPLMGSSYAESCANRIRVLVAHVVDFFVSRE